MTKKISKAIIMVSCITLLSAIILIAGSLNNYFTSIQRANQKEDLALVALGVDEIGLSFLESIETHQYRITWIDAEGVVLFDSEADVDTMENHGSRKEVLLAKEYGTGEDKRTSATLSEETLYSAKMLNDGTIIRISFTQLTIISLVYNMMKTLIIIIIISVILSIFLASRTAKKAVDPINNLDLDNPLHNDVYDEINPLLHRIDKQNKKIQNQIDVLKRQKEEIAFIADNVADGIIMLNKKGNIISCNKVAKKIFDCKVDDYFLNFFRDLDYEVLIEDALKGKDGKRKMKFGNEFYYFAASPILSNDENFAVFLFIHNITEEENALEIRRQFSANVSHELKTPLTSIMGAAELLTTDIVKPEDIKGFAANIQNEAANLLKLVQDIIKISRLDEQSKFEFEDTDLKVITNEVLSKLKAKADKKNIEINTEIINANIKAVPTVLYEMLYNLTDNAINYNKEGGKIFINMIKNNNSIIWQIKDTGVGIEQEQLPRIFERFYRIDKSHSKDTGGTGLGLSIVKNGAVLHKAKLDATSTIGKGTTITLEF